MYKKIMLITAASAMFVGCASVPMETAEKTDEVKKFSAPSQGNSGLYIYRSSGVGTALKKDIWVDDKCIGETASKVFFYEEVKGGVEHKVSTESEFSPNDLLVKTNAGENYFIKQYIKFGVFVGGAGLKLVNEEEGKAAIAPLGLAVKGVCSSGT